MPYVTVIVYADNYGSRDLDVEVAVNLHGSESEIRVAKRKLEKAFLSWFKADKAYKQSPKERVQWHSAVVDSGESDKKGFSGLDSRTKYGKPIDEFNLLISKKLRAHYHGGQLKDDKGDEEGEEE